MIGRSALLSDSLPWSSDKTGRNPCGPVAIRIRQREFWSIRYHEYTVTKGWHVSVEPPPKQGCEHISEKLGKAKHAVSVEPPPKQGCEHTGGFTLAQFARSQWNPRRSRGARLKAGTMIKIGGRLSGTPAEAGVRESVVVHVFTCARVSVEPPPKQGCERTRQQYALDCY